MIAPKQCKADNTWLGADGRYHLYFATAEECSQAVSRYHSDEPLFVRVKGENPAVEFQKRYSFTENCNLLLFNRTHDRDNLLEVIE